MKRPNGFTFIEVLIALVVSGIVISGLLTGVNLAGKSAQHNANKTMAFNLAQGLMEEIKDERYQDPENPRDHSGGFSNFLGTENNDSGIDDIDDYNGYTDSVVLYPNLAATGTVGIIGLDGNGNDVDANGDEVVDSSEYENITHKWITVTYSWDYWQGPSPSEEVVTIVTGYN